jgi:hypothetical protein
MDTFKPREIAVPITSSWWTMKCTIEEDDGKYLFRFKDGTRREYQPGMDVLEAALSLKLAEDEPSPDVLKFVNDYGPTDRLNECLQQELAVDVWLEVLEKAYPDEVQWMESKIEYLRNELAKGLYVSWSNLYRDLYDLQRIYLEWKATGNLELFSRHIKDLRPCIVESAEGAVWEFGFTTLYDALVGLLAQSIVEGRSWKTCPYCRKVFINGKRRFCNDQCREAYHNKKKSDAVGREQQRLYQTLRRRREKDLIDDATFEKVRRQINEATTLDDLKNVERKNSKLYARLKPGPTLNGGPRQCKY